MTINIEYETNINLNLDYENIVKSVVRASLDQEKCPYETEVNVEIFDDDMGTELIGTYIFNNNGDFIREV